MSESSVAGAQMRMPARSRGYRWLVAFSAVALAFVAAGVQAPTASADVPSSSRTAIANKALAQRGNTCSGYSITVGSTTYHACSYQWCSIFAGWVWHAADSAIDMAGIGTYAKDFYDYGVAHGTRSTTPQVGGAVVFVDVQGGNSSHIHHVGIVTSVGSSTINYVGGNETPAGGGTPIVGYHTGVNSSIGTKSGSVWIYGYLSAVEKPTGLFVTISNPADGQVSFSWQMGVSPDEFKVTRIEGSTTKTLAASLPGSARQIYDYTSHGHTYTYNVCALTGSAYSCSSKTYAAP
jgi:hypothetical protein